MTNRSQILALVLAMICTACGQAAFNNPASVSIDTQPVLAELSGSDLDYQQSVQSCINGTGVNTCGAAGVTHVLLANLNILMCFQEIQVASGLVYPNRAEVRMTLANLGPSTPVNKSNPGMPTGPGTLTGAPPSFDDDAAENSYYVEKPIHYFSNNGFCPTGRFGRVTVNMQNAFAVLAINGVSPGEPVALTTQVETTLSYPSAMNPIAVTLQQQFMNLNICTAIVNGYQTAIPCPEEDSDLDPMEDLDMLPDNNLGGAIAF